MSQSQPDQKSIIVSGCIFVAVASALFAAATVVLFMRNQIDRRERTQELQEFLEQELERAELAARADTLELYRPHAGYTVTRPSRDWEIEEDVEPPLDLECRHDAYGVFEVSVLDSTADAASILLHWLREQETIGYRIDTFSYQPVTVGGCPAHRAEIEAEYDGNYERAIVVAVEGPPGLLLEIYNDAGSFTQGREDYELIVASFRPLTAVPTPEPTAVETPRDYRGGPAG